MEKTDRFIFIIKKDEIEKTYIIDANYPQEAVKALATILTDIESAKRVVNDMIFYAIRMNQKFKELTGYDIVHFSTIKKEYYNEKPVFWGADQCQS